MKDEEIKKGINELRRITMTPEEKNRVFENILSHKNLARQSEKSPWFTSFEFFIQRNRVFSYGTFVLLFIVLGSGGLVSASQKSLPGNTLYSLKVNFVEPAGSLLRYIPAEKAQYESNLATKRLVEAETLAKENKLDTKKEKQINDLLTKHTIALDKAIEMAEENKSEEKIYEIAVNFQNEMNIHAEKLDQVKNQVEDKTIEEDVKKEIPIVKEIETKQILPEETQEEKQISEDPEKNNLSKELPQIESENELTANLELEPIAPKTSLMMAPSTTSNTIPDVTEEKIINEEQTEITIETPEEISEKIENQEEYQNIEKDEYKYEENLISQNARANAQRIKDILERKYNIK